MLSNCTGWQHGLGLPPKSCGDLCVNLKPLQRRLATLTMAVPQARDSHQCSTSREAVAAPAAVGHALLAGLLLLSDATPAVASIATLEGPARVVDGDTLYIGNDKVRLYAIDAPEKTQSCNNSKGQPYMCGQVSLQALKEHVGSRTVRCDVKTKDQYGRNVAACSILSGRLSEDMGSWLVSNGLAVAYRQYGKEYAILEEKAHATHKGIWQGTFTEPSLWRKQQKAVGLTSSSLPAAMPVVAPAPAAGSSQPAPAVVAAGGLAAPSCAAVAAAPQQVQQPNVVRLSDAAGQCSGPLVKGNINNKGEKIYHTVSSGAYMKVEIDERAGERYFCTEQEAQAAGWRPARR